MKKKLFFVLGIILLLVILVFTFNGIVVLSSKNRIINIDEVNNIDNVDAILVLGCKVNPDGTPSMMLRNRAEKGIELYKKTGIKILLSGDHDTKGYDEVNTMKDMVKDSIPKEDIFLDHAGLSTYDSIYRAKNIYGINKMIIVTQKYHLYRALYIASKLGIEAYGIEADNIPYPFINIKNEIREVLARDKDFFKLIFKPKSKYMGEPIDIHSSGEITFD
jgi:vancomycin permeability regulator SanA